MNLDSFLNGCRTTTKASDDVMLTTSDVLWEQPLPSARVLATQLAMKTITVIPPDDARIRIRLKPVVGVFAAATLPPGLVFTVTSEHLYDTASVVTLPNFQHFKLPGLALEKTRPRETLPKGQSGKMSVLADVASAIRIPVQETGSDRPAYNAKLQLVSIPTVVTCPGTSKFGEYIVHLMQIVLTEVVLEGVEILCLPDAEFFCETSGKKGPKAAKTGALLGSK